MTTEISQTNYFWQCVECDKINPKTRANCSKCATIKPFKTVLVNIIDVQLTIDFIYLRDLVKNMVVTSHDRRVLRLIDSKRGLVKNVECLAEFNGKATGFINEMGTVYAFNLQYLILEDKRTLIPIELTYSQKIRATKIRRQLSTL